MPESTRRQIGKYQIRAELGRGGFGVVYSAYDPTVGRPVAVKVLTALGDNQLLTRFKNEAAAAGNLRHKNIVTIYDYGDDNGAPYIVMELLEGEDLNQIIAAGKPLSLLQKVSIMIQVADGLRSAHRAGVVHRDVKPGNIRLLPDGSVKLMDFGIARVVASSAGTRLTRQGHVIGTLYYMAPEQLMGEDVDALSDIFAYGSTYYELLTGKHPFQGTDPRTVFHKITAEDPEPIRNLVPDCPEALERIVNRALQKDRDLRYQSLRDVQVDTEPILIELRQERAASLVAEAKRLYSGRDLEGAQTLLGEVFDLDTANRDARQLYETIQKNVLKRLIGPRIESFVKRADDAVSGRRYEEAIESLEAALRLDRTDQIVSVRLNEARGLLTLSREMARLIADARRQFSKQDLEGALEVLLRVQERDPSHPEAQRLLNEVRSAITVRERERDFEEKFQEATHLLEAKHFDRAAQLLENLGEEFKIRQEVVALAADIRSGKESFERQQQLSSEIAAIRELMAAAQFEAAIKRIEALMNRFPEEVEPTRLFILAHRKLAEHRKTQALDKLDNELKRQLEGEHFERALSLVSQSLKTYPAEPRLLDTQRRIEGEWEQYKREIAIRQLLKDGEQYAAENDLGKAAEILETAARQFPAEPRLANLLASTRDALAAKRREAAVVDLLNQSQAQSNRRDYALALEAIDFGLAEYGRDDRLTAMREKVAAEKAAWERTEAIREIAEKSHELVACGDFEQALRLLRSSLQEFPEEVPLTSALGYAQDALEAKHREEAIVALLNGAEAQLHSGEFQPALDALDRGLTEYGQDHRLTALREQVADAKAARERAAAIELVLQEAQNLVAEENFHSAIAGLESAMRRYGEDGRLANGLASAQAALDAKKRNDAIKVLCDQADTFAANRDFARALQAVDEGVALHGADWRLTSLREEVLVAQAAWLRLETVRQANEAAAQHLSENQPENALAVLDSALAQYANEPQLLEARVAAEAALKAKRREEAIVALGRRAEEQLAAGAYEDALDLLSGGLTEFDGDGRLAGLRMKVELAKAAWERAETIRQLADESRRLVAQKAFEDAVVLLEYSVERYGEHPQLTESLAAARAALEAKRRDEAIAAVTAQSHEELDRREYGNALKLVDEALAKYGADSRLTTAREEILSAKAKWERTEAIRQVGEQAKIAIAQEEFEKAVALLEAGANRYDEDPQLAESLAAARVLLEGKRRDEAVNALCRQLEAQIDEHEFTRALETVEEGLGQYGHDARLTAGREKVVLAQAEWKRSETTRQTIENAQRHLAGGRAEEALAAIDSALAQYAGEPSLLEARAIGEQALAAKRRESAILALQRQAQAHLEAGAYQSALDLLTRGLAEFNGDGRLAELRTAVELAKAEWERAEAVRRIAEDSRQLVAEKEFENAIALLESALNEYPGQPQLTEAVEAARAALAAKQRDDAIDAAITEARANAERRDYTIALDLLDESATRYGKDGRLTGVRDEIFGAKAAWERAEAVRELVQEAQACIAQENFEKSIALLESGRKRYGAEPQISETLAAARDALAAKRRDEAIEMVCKQAQVHTDNGDFTRALKTVDRGAAGYGRDERLALMRDQVLAAEAQWERARFVRLTTEDAEKRMAQGKPERAVQLIESALEKYPADPQLTGFLANARKALDAVRREEGIRSLLVQIENDLQSREWERALDALDRGLKEYGADQRIADLAEEVVSAKAHWDRAAALRQIVTDARTRIQAQHPESAVELLESARAQFDGEPLFEEAVAAARDGVAAKQKEQAIEAACQAARAELESGQYDRALEILDNASRDQAGEKKEKKDDRLAAVRDQILKARAERARAESIREVLAESGNLVSGNDLEGAMELLTRGLASYPGAPDLVKALSEVREALQAAQKETAISELSRETRLFIGMQDFPTALAIVEEGLKTYGGETRLSDLRETVLLARADWQRTESVRQVVDAAENLISTGTPEEACRLLEQTLSRYPGDPMLLDAHGRARDSLERKRREGIIQKLCAEARGELDHGKYEIALEQIERGRKDYPDDRRLLELRDAALAAKAEAQRIADEIKSTVRSAESLREHGELEEAVALLEKALTEHPGNSELVGAIVSAIDTVGAEGTVAIDNICTNARQLMLTGNFDLAFLTIEQALRLHGDEQTAPLQESPPKTRTAAVKTASAGTTGASLRRDSGHGASVKEETGDHVLGESQEQTDEIPLLHEPIEPPSVFSKAGLTDEPLVTPPPVAETARGRPIKRWLMGSAAAMLLVVLLWLISSVRTPKMGILRVRTFPPNATVRVNDQICSTPSCELRLKPGQYRIQVSAEGYRDRAISATLASGSARSPIEIALEPLSPSAHISANFADGDVLLDNHRAGRIEDGGFTLELDPGRHSLQVSSRDGNASISFDVDYAKLPVFLNVSQQNTAVIAVGSFARRAVLTCSGCSGGVSIDDRPAGELRDNSITIDKVAPGTHRVKIGTGRIIVFTATGAPGINLAIASDRNYGTLIVETGQDNATVFVDGKKYPRSTLHGQLLIPAEAKAHTVRVAKDGYRAEPPEMRVQVARGDQFQARFKLAPEPSRLLVSGQVAEADVMVDGSRIGTVASDGTFSVELSPGDHRIQFRKDGRTSPQVQRSFEPGRRVTISQSDAPLAAKSNPVPEAPKADPNAAEQADWQHLTGSATVAQLQEFLTKHPAGIHRREAERLLQGLQQQQAAAEREQAWAATDKNSKSSLRAFLSRYGEGMHAEDARTLITGIDAQEAEAVRAGRMATQQANRTAADSNAILNTLSQFQDAFNRKDLSQLQNIWTPMPKATAEIYRSEFREAKSLQYSLTPVGQPRVDGDTAAIICTRSQTFVPKNGQHPPPTSERVRVVLARFGAQWVIRTISPLGNE